MRFFFFFFLLKGFIWVYMVQSWDIQVFMDLPFSSNLSAGKSRLSSMKMWDSEERWLTVKYVAEKMSKLAEMMLLLLRLVF